MKTLFSVLFVLFSITCVMGQKKMSYQNKTMTLAIPRVNNNEAVVIISAPDIYQLNFESTLDKTVEVYNKVNESTFNYYFLKFIVGDRYRGRKLEIKVAGYDKTVIPISLTAKEVQSYYVFDPDGTVGVGCYFQNRNEGIDFLKKAMYSEAKDKFSLAILCTDKPTDDNLKKRIEDADMCVFLRRKADNEFETKNYEKAEEYYKEVLAININDEYCQTRINDCTVAYANLCRRVHGIVTNSNNNPLAKVEIKGAIKVKRNKYEGEKSIGFTDENGRYDILVRQQYNALEFSETLLAKVYMEIPNNGSNEINVVMKPSKGAVGINVGKSLFGEYLKTITK